jgi:hypothetical protein
MIVYAIEPAQPEFLLQENINLNLEIRNQGSEAIAVPDPMQRTNSQPVYGLVSPGSVPPAKFSNWTRHGSGDEPPPPKTTTIEPGSAWTGRIPLNRIASLEEPGDYRIGSMLAYQGGSARAQERAFKLNRPDPVSLHIGQGERPFNVGQGLLVFLQREAASTGLYAMGADETDPSNSELILQAARRRYTAGANATDVLCPWMNKPVFSEMLKFIVWREGRTLKTITDAEKQPSSFELPLEPDHLVRPPLRTAGGPIEVLAIQGRTLAMVSVPPKLQARPVLSWRADLPAQPSFITAALGPADSGNIRHIAFAVKHSDSFEVFHAQYTPSGLGTVSSVRVGEGILFDVVTPTLAITGDGAAHVACVRSSNGGKVLAVVDVVFGAGPQPQVSTRALPALEKPVTGGALLLVVTKGAITRREVALVSDGDLWNIGASGAFRKLEPRRAFFSPVTIVPGLELSYVLYQTPNGAFQFLPLNR